MKAICLAHYFMDLWICVGLICVLGRAESPVALAALEAGGSVHRIIGFHPRCCPLPSSSKPFSYLYVLAICVAWICGFCVWWRWQCLLSTRSLSTCPSRPEPQPPTQPFQLGSSGAFRLWYCQLKISSGLVASTDGALGWSVLQAGQVNQLQRFEKLKL